MHPILYSFRRCPYAIRARLAIASSGIQVELREVFLRDKPQAFLDASPTATVPCLVTEGIVLDESYDIMRWALAQSDPEQLEDMPDDGVATDAMKMLAELEPLLVNGWLFGTRPTLADLAILPFVRQFAMIEKPRFDTEATPHVSAWLETFLASDRLAAVTMFP